VRTQITANWRRLMSPVAAGVVLAVIAFAFAGCGGGGGGDASSTVVAPGVPTNFTVVGTSGQTLSATLTWSPPAAGGVPTSYEIYRSTTAGTAFQPDNHLISVPVVTGQASYTYVDGAGLTPVDTYWVVSAKNAGGETPTAEATYKPVGPPGGGDEGYGNNFSAALVFADDIGIGGVALDPTKTWTTDLALIDYNTGLRPLSTEVLPVATLPYFDPASAYLLGAVTYYEQQTASTWQGQWVAGASEQQHVTAKWGDNLVSQSLTTNSVVRIEMVLSKALTVPMTSYTMQSLYGTKANEIQGTDGVTYDNLTAFVFASNAHLKIQKVDASGTPLEAPLYDQTLWTGDGPGFLAGEVNVSGNFTYGFVWMLNKEVLAYPKNGIWRLTFSLDATSPKGTTNNTFIDAASNGTLVSATEVYIDINVTP